jgi:ketosteroid isomerase-like protein
MTSSALPVPAPAIAEAQLRAINHRFINAFCVNDTEWMATLTAADFLLISTGGEWLDRSQHLARMAQPFAADGAHYDDVRIRLFGTVALVHGLFEAIDVSHQIRRVRYTDVYQWNGITWLLISAQNTALRPGIATSMNQGTAPACSPWQRVDPVCDELQLLYTLNEHYVRAFRDANVAWYDAHLTADYLVISGDGSLNDRAQALANFAKPTFANDMQSFPVGDVRIRRFDDVALIHAENAYELKDGRKGISRYTDIWCKQADGSWSCVAAHITPHKAPG